MDINHETRELLRIVGHKIATPLTDILQIAERLLALLTIESLGKNQSSVDLMAAIYLAYELVLPSATEHQPQITLNLSSSSIVVKANSTILQQALQILFMNAIRLTEDDAIIISVYGEQGFAVVSLHNAQSVDDQRRISIGEFVRGYANSEISLDLLYCRQAAEMSGGEFWLTGDSNLGNIGWQISWPLSESESKLE